MGDFAIVSIGFATFVGVWWFIVRRMKAMGRSAISRHFLGAILGFFSWMIALVVLLGATGKLDESPSVSAGNEHAAESSNTPSPDSVNASLTDSEEAAVESTPSGPEQYDSVLAMVEKMNDYPPESDLFAIESDDPLRVRISPEVFKLEPEDVVYYQNWRAAIYAVYNSFIHTDAESIVVEATPLQYESLTERDDPAFVDSNTIILDVSRSDALSAIQTLIDAASFSDLKVEQDGYYHWSESFQSVYYESESPGLDAFIEKLSDFCSNECQATLVADSSGEPSELYVSEPTSPELKGGSYIACVSEDLLDQANQALVDEDQRALEYLGNNGCGVPNGGIPVSVLDQTWTGKVHIRAYTDQGALELWTVMEAIAGYP